MVKKFLIFLSFSIFVFGETFWQKMYEGEEAKGKDVLGLWQFLPGKETEDSSGKGLNLKLYGKSVFNKDGKFGSCLEVFYTEEDKQQGAVVLNSSNLSPEGPFSIEMWIKPKAELSKRTISHLIDKMAVSYAHKNPDVECMRDYMIVLEGKEGEMIRKIRVILGFGKEGGIINFISKPIELKEGEWYHIGFSYNGEGKGRIYLNGELVGEGYFPEKKSILPGKRSISIGDRGISLYSSFPGYIDQVRITSKEINFSGKEITLEEKSIRRNFVRMEKDAKVLFSFKNEKKEIFKNLEVDFFFNGQKIDTLRIPEILPDKEISFTYKIDTSLKCGTYELKIVLKDGKNIYDEKAIPITIVERKLPDIMPVVMWGGGPTDIIKEYGFTHKIAFWGDNKYYSEIWDKNEPLIPSVDKEILMNFDNALSEGIHLCIHASPHRIFNSRDDLKKYLRIDKNGNIYERINVCGLFKEVQEFFYKTGASIGMTFKEFPSWSAVLLQSEVRDGTNVCFHEVDINSFIKRSGYGIPEEVKTKWGVNYKTLKDFPENRIIPDNHPVLVYYKWFWKEGDGWSDLLSQMNKGIKSVRPDVWSWFDPAVRVPPIWGSGGDVDYLSQWTYTYPDPEKIGFATDELMAMAKGKEGKQNIMKMTQIIWYRSQTAPQIRDDYQADWEKNIPDAKFITIAPDHLKIAFWSKISRPIKGIMYHGIGSLFEGIEHSSYRYTNSDTKYALKELIEKVVKPLGPSLIKVPDIKSEVAFLESFTSNVFAQKGTWGWGNGWIADVYLILRYAQIQPEVIYEETILKYGLDGYKVLFLMDCDVLSESVAKKILEFQKKGGIVVGDENLAPGIKPDIVMESYKRTKKADIDKQVLIEKSKWLRGVLDKYINRVSDSDNIDILTRVRRYGNTDYLFAYNDKRKFGKYVGHHGLVMEEGVETEGKIKIRRKSGYIYDPINQKEIKCEIKDGWIEIEEKFKPGEGKLFIITDRPVKNIIINLPSSAKLGESINLEIKIVDDRSRNINGVIPVKVDIIDPKNEIMEFSGYYGAEDGVLKIKYGIAKNDEVGKWNIKVKELLSGIEKEKSFSVK